MSPANLFTVQPLPYSSGVWQCFPVNTLFGNMSLLYHKFLLNMYVLAHGFKLNYAEFITHTKFARYLHIVKDF